MFRVTKEIWFCYGHRLLNYSGKCATSTVTMPRR